MHPSSLAPYRQRRLFTASSVSVAELTPRANFASPSDRPSCGLLLARGGVVSAPQAACRATASRTPPRRRAIKPRHGFRAFAHRRPASADFCSWPAVVPAARRLRRQHKAAHGSSGYAGAPLAVLHFVARRRLPAVKRTAAMPGVSACKVKTVPPAALRIHSAATRPKSCRAPSSFLLHSAGRTRPRQTRCAGLPVKYKTGLRFASVGLNPPGCSLRSTAHRRAGVNRKRLNITAHYPK